MSFPLDRRRLPSIVVTVVAVGLIGWAAAQAPELPMRPAAVEDNGCSVTAGNGRVVSQPARNCPVDISLGNVLTTSAGDAPDLAPGDTAERPIDVTNTGRTSFDRLTLGLGVSGSLADDLTISLRRCSTAWNAAPSGSTYSCAGTTTVLAADVAPTTILELAPTPAAARNGTDRLLVSVRFRADAPNDLQAGMAEMTYTFTAARGSGT